MSAWESPFGTWSLVQTFSSGYGPFEGLLHAPANLDAIHPPDYGVSLTRVTPDGFNTLHAQLFNITRVNGTVPEPATIAILLVGLAGLMGLTRYAGQPRPQV
jgi:hypothetical protein